jgi:hypothetical protein
MSVTIKTKQKKEKINKYKRIKNCFAGYKIIRKNLVDFCLSPGLLNRFSSAPFYLD